VRRVTVAPSEGGAGDAPVAPTLRGAAPVSTTVAGLDGDGLGNGRRKCRDETVIEDHVLPEK